MQRRKHETRVILKVKRKKKHCPDGKQGGFKGIKNICYITTVHRMLLGRHEVQHAAFCSHTSTLVHARSVSFSSCCSIETELDVYLYLKEVQLIYYVQYCVFYTVFLKKG